MSPHLDTLFHLAYDFSGDKDTHYNLVVFFKDLFNFFSK